MINTKLIGILILVALVHPSFRSFAQNTYILKAECTNVRNPRCNWHDASAWEGNVIPNGAIPAGSTIYVGPNQEAKVGGGVNKVEITNPVVFTNNGKVDMTTPSARLDLPSGSQINAGTGAVFDGGNNSTVMSIGTAEVKGDEIDNLVAPNTFTEGNLTSGGCANAANNCNVVNPLPVVLLSFKPQIDHTTRNVKLNWATASEENFHYFELSRSVNGLEFDLIATIESKSKNGYTNIRQDYSYTDHRPYHGLNYYRLTSVDYDGYTEVFTMVAVQLNGDLKPMIFPNPVISNTISIGGLSANNPYNLAIYSLNGQKNFEVRQAFQNTIQLSPALQQGIYIAQITIGDQVFSQKILVK